MIRPTYDVNGKPLHTSQYFSFGGQVATFVTNYLGAPVSLKEILEDMGQAGATLRPRSSHDGNADGDETQFRYVMGPKIARDVAACEPTIFPCSSRCRLCAQSQRDRCPQTTPTSTRPERT